MSGHLERMSDDFDKALLGLLKDGRKIMNKDGDLVDMPATAADLNVIRQRLKDCGITAVPTGANPIGNIVKEMQARGMTMPPLNDEEDLATG
tara:strand:- start:323 stop:598 length:276 start_codon:yes stop_codon:yes gene_type:complete